MSTRRAISAALLLGALGLALPHQVAAQDWPNRPITAIVPLGAGSASDIIGRVVMEQVGKQLGQTVIVENRPGAGGTIGANMVAKAAPDGYTVLVYGALASAHALYAKLPYDTFADLVPVASLGQQILVVITSPDKGYKALSELVAAAKAKPGTLNYSSAGVGSASHIGAERLRTSVNFDAQHIPFRGAAEAVTDVVAGRVDFSVQLPATTLPLIKDGKLIALAVSSDKRSSMFPNVPTTIEAGLPSSSVYPFYTGVYLPAKTPDAVVQKLAAEIAKALQVDTVKARLAQLGVDPMPMTVEQFGKFLKDDVAANIEVVKAAKIPTQQ